MSGSMLTIGIMRNVQQQMVILEIQYFYKNKGLDGLTFNPI
jgi:hypothetical protein